MGFGGATAAMITALKNNNRRKQREPFSNLKTATKGTSRVPNKPISKETLEKIRIKIQAENKALLKKRIIIFSILLLILLTGATKLIFY